MRQKSASRPKVSSASDYTRFDQLDGQHPWQEIVPEGCVNYNARILSQGKVGYFNFNLAKEMGLIPKNHPHELNKSLETKLLNTFNLRIINEYELTHNKRYQEDVVKPYPFMATRYLQLQHDNKQGLTSGDGRGMWNGLVAHKGQAWDVSSRGTGVTTLAPGAAKAGVPLQTGNIHHGYGCGLAEIDELYSSALMSEILHNNGYETERVLVIIDHPNSYGIGVRAGKNLFRPAHLFMYLKQNNYSELQRATDYLIERQVKNKRWALDCKSKSRYNKMLDAVVNDFAQFAANLERDYIFAWLDWDGDNVLMDAGIIDYGSIRQFGVRHDQYRYDDVERYSTNLNEQKNKAMLMIQVFCQMIDYLNTKQKRPLADFKNHAGLKKFEKAFNYYLLKRFLQQVGLNENTCDDLLLKQKSFVQNTYDMFLKLETLKTKKLKEFVEDGVNRPPVLNMRKFLIELSNYLNQKDGQLIDYASLYESNLVEHHNEEDALPSSVTEKNIFEFCTNYFKLIEKAELTHRQKSKSAFLKEIKTNCSTINSSKRVTGNALVYIVNELLKKKSTGFTQGQIQMAIEAFVAEQKFLPELSKTSKEFEAIPNKTKALMRTVLAILDEHKEDI